MGTGESTVMPIDWTAINKKVVEEQPARDKVAVSLIEQEQAVDNSPQLEKDKNSRQIKDGSRNYSGLGIEFSPKMRMHFGMNNADLSPDAPTEPIDVAKREKLNREMSHEGSKEFLLPLKDYVEKLFTKEHVMGQLQGLVDKIDAFSKHGDITKEGFTDVLDMSNIGGIAGTFIGKGSKLFDKVERNIFLELENLGRSPKRIKELTGMERDIGGNMMKEISDRPMKVTIPTTKMKPSLQGNFTGTHASLDDVVDHPYLKAAYPDIFKNYKIEFQVSSRRGAAHVRPIYYEGKMVEPPRLVIKRTQQDFDMLSLGESNYSAKVLMDNVKSSMIHEIQHAIQYKEGWELGANFGDILKGNVNLHGGNLPENALRKMSFKEYESYVGEVQARNAQNRMDMTSSERKMSLSEETEDISRMNQIRRIKSPEFTTMDEISPTEFAKEFPEFSESLLKTPLYHGTSKDAPFKEFKDSSRGTFVTANKADASAYALENDSQKLVYEGGKYEAKNTASRVMPVYVNAKKIMKLSEEEVKAYQKTTNYAKFQKEMVHKAKLGGFDAIDYGGGTFAIVNTKSIKSALSPKIGGISQKIKDSFIKRLSASYLKHNLGKFENPAAMVNGRSAAAISKVEGNIEAQLIKSGVSKVRDINGDREIDTIMSEIMAAARKHIK